MGQNTTKPDDINNNNVKLTFNNVPIGIRTHGN